MKCKVRFEDGMSWGQGCLKIITCYQRKKKADEKRRRGPEKV